jgi:hypothetical protein
MDCLLLKVTLAMRLHQGNLLKGIDKKPLEKKGFSRLLRVQNGLTLQ